MDVEAAIMTLRAELRQMDEAILALEQVFAANRPRRGRPPKMLLAGRTPEDQPMSQAKAAPRER